MLRKSIQVNVGDLIKQGVISSQQASQMEAMSLANSQASLQDDHHHQLYLSARQWRFISYLGAFFVMMGAIYAGLGIHFWFGLDVVALVAAVLGYYLCYDGAAHLNPKSQFLLNMTRTLGVLAVVGWAVMMLWVDQILTNPESWVWLKRWDLDWNPGLWSTRVADVIESPLLHSPFISWLFALVGAFYWRSYTLTVFSVLLFGMMIDGWVSLYGISSFLFLSFKMPHLALCVYGFLALCFWSASRYLQTSDLSSLRLNLPTRAQLCRVAALFSWIMVNVDLMLLGYADVYVQVIQVVSQTLGFRFESVMVIIFWAMINSLGVMWAMHFRMIHLFRLSCFFVFLNVVLFIDFEGIDYIGITMVLTGLIVWLFGYVFWRLERYLLLGMDDLNH